MTILFGPTSDSNGTTFRLWAPGAKSVGVAVGDKTIAMNGSDGWFETTVKAAGIGTRYAFVIDGDVTPDPASQFQPDDVLGPSQIVDHNAYRWTQTDWRGRPWHEAVLVECHVGTFSASGNYRGIVEKLDSLVDAGFSALELMPINDFPGTRNWGYDGVLWYAPDHIYGSPDDLKYLIDGAHARGLMIFLDVVYNHFGPEGNYLGRYAPEFFREAQTPWGAAVDYDNEVVRQFAIQNALYWLDTYRFDGLRLDAVHAIVEPGGLQLLRELSDAVGALASRSDRHIHLMLENDDNRASVLDARTPVPAGKYRAQWNDDYHHAWHVLLSGESHGYYSDYKRAPKQDIAKMLRQGFAYQGQPSPHRKGAQRGEPSSKLSPLAFVNFLQNHDQIGNRALGDRLEWIADGKPLEAAIAILLLAPMIPMMFMGEEWGARSPFPFFCDFKGDLANSVRAGRRKEFAEAYETYGDDVPDPLAESTFRSATLNWEERETVGKPRLDLVKSLLAIRRNELVPHLADSSFVDSELDDTGEVLTARWQLGKRSLRLIANLGDRPRSPSSAPSGRAIWGKATGDTLLPWSVQWLVKDAA